MKVAIASLALATIVSALIPTPNMNGGGDAKMFIFIVATVIFKATIEFFLRKRQKKKEVNSKDKHP